jgi:MATE family multidrug resistance protein
MAMGMVDTMMVGRVSPAAMGGVSVGAGLFYTVAVFGTGLLLGLDTLVSHSFGAGDPIDCRRSLIAALWMILPLSVLLVLLSWLFIPFVRWFGVQPSVLSQTIPYLEAVSWSAIPLLLFFALRRYLQGMGIVRPVMFALVSANLVDAAANWILIFGHFGAPALGAAGAGWSTTICRIYMVIYLIPCAARTFTGGESWRPDLSRVRRLLSLGLPAATQFSFEVAVFAAVTSLIARIDEITLASHQIALLVASLTYMVPLGISSAGAVRVGQAIGRRDLPAAALSGWTALALGAGFMACAGLLLVLAPHAIGRIFTDQAEVVGRVAPLLAVAAAFQLFDGIQTVGTGILRGAGDTHTTMVAHLGCYWLIGLPTGYWLCFSRGWGAVGLWAGLCLALVLIGCIALVAWTRRIHWRTHAL